MTDEPVLIEQPIPHVLLVRINRPERRNAINGVVAAGIDSAVRRAELDSSIRVVVLAATGDQSFCAGADLGEVAAGRQAALSTEVGGFAGIVEAQRSKPWIAAVEAVAMGGGLEICLALDMIIASDRAQFGLPEAKQGLIAGAAGVFRIAQRIAPSVAYEMLTTGNPIGAERAYELGLVNRVVPAGEAVTAALSLAAVIAGNAPLAVQQSLRVARAAAVLNEDSLFAEMREAGRIVRTSVDAREGPKAFLEKRQPVWTGR